MSKIKNFLSAPYPVVSSPWKIILMCTVLVAFLMFVIRPLGMFRYDTAGKVLRLAGNVLVVPLVHSAMSYIAPVLWPHYYAEESWTMGRNAVNIVVLCLLITLGEMGYNALVYDTAFFSFANLGLCVLCTLLFAPIPIFLSYIWASNVGLRHHLAEAGELNRRLAAARQEANESECPSLGDDESPLTLANGAKDVFSVDSGRVLYGVADGNYIKIYYLPKDDVGRACKLVRTTMKQAEAAFSGGHIVRCHRAYFVNIRRVCRVEGNMQGYRLHVEQCVETVPVSRTYAKAVRTLVEV